MRLTVWGARGSIPVSGPQYLKYGGDTTCCEIETSAGDTVILDAGTGLRALGNKLIKEGRKEFHFLVTHAHWDHLFGFPFFKPLYRSDAVLRFYGCSCAHNSIRLILQETMRAPFFPVDLKDVTARVIVEDECLEKFEMAGLQCRSVNLNHPNGGFGFRLAEGSRSIVFIPDNEFGYRHPGGRGEEEYAEFSAGADLLLHDGEYTRKEHEQRYKGWGHSVYEDTVRLAIKARVGQLLLWHTNQDRTDEEADTIAADAQRIIKQTGGDVDCRIAATGLTVML